MPDINIRNWPTAEAIVCPIMMTNNNQIINCSIFKCLRTKYATGPSLMSTPAICWAVTICICLGNQVGNKHKYKDKDKYQKRRQRKK